MIDDNHSIFTDFINEHRIMGFADLSITDIATEYSLSVETVFHLCDEMGVTYKNQQTNLALEDAKAIISQILSQKSGSMLSPFQAVEIGGIPD